MSNENDIKIEAALRTLRFHSHVNEALRQLQLLEFTLKAYMRVLYWNLDHLRPCGVRFLLTQKQLDRMPLGSLLRLFRRHSDDRSLLSQLEELERGRIYIAHQAMLWNLRPPGKDEDKALEDVTVRAHGILVLARTFTLTLLEEVKRLQEVLPIDQRDPEWR